MATKKKNTVDQQIQRFEATKKGKQQVEDLEVELRIAQQMAELIEKSGLSVRAVARRMGTSASQLHRVLNFEVSTSISTLVRFSAAVGYSFQANFVTEPVQQSPAAQPDAAEQVKSFLQDFEERLDSRFAKLESAIETLQFQQDADFVIDDSFKSHSHLREPVATFSYPSIIPAEWSKN